MVYVSFVELLAESREHLINTFGKTDSEVSFQKDFDNVKKG